MFSLYMFWQGFSLFGVSQIIQSAATQQQAYLWANLAVAVCSFHHLHVPSLPL
jgi:amino acid permease